jgi:hypothetical protein
MYTRSASFHRNAGSEPVFGGGRAFRRNTVTSPRKRDACRTLAPRADSKPYRDPLHGNEGVEGSSPSEGLKFLQIAPFLLPSLGAISESGMAGSRTRSLQEL